MTEIIPREKKWSSALAFQFLEKNSVKVFIFSASMSLQPYQWWTAFYVSSLSAEQQNSRAPAFIEHLSMAASNIITKSTKSILFNDHLGINKHRPCIMFYVLNFDFQS